MAYTALDLGYIPSAGLSYTATTDSSSDWGSVPNGTFFYDKTEERIIFKDSNGIIVNEYSNSSYIISSTQWSKGPITPTALANGQVANGFTFFDDATDKVANGTTSYDEYNIAFGIDLTLTGTSGTANINIDGTDYLATFNTDLATTAQDWIALHGATLKALDVRVLYNGGSPLNPDGDETIRFCASEASCNSVTITTVTGDLNGTRINPFTGVNAAAGDHVLIPYVDQPYENLRIHHNFRVNFSIGVGTQQNYALSLRRFADDSIIGSEQLIFRTPDEGSQLFTFATYTAGANDPFVEGGFYFALRNDSGLSCDIEGNVGILLQQTFQRSVDFS